MAAPTNVRSEAVDYGVIRLRWTYPGANDVKVYQSTDGVSYSVVATIAVGTTSYDDEDLLDQTKYWYKLSDDVGSTFSSVVTCVTYRASSKRASKSNFAISPLKDQPVPKNLNDLAYALNEELNVKKTESTPCDLCLNDGALVIDCTSGCEWFRVTVTQDINSISLLGCDDCPKVDFIIPPNETFGVCGWPQGCDFAGDECFQAPIPGGTNGRTAKTNGLSYDGYGPSPQIVSAGCKCPPGTRTLSIKCCSADCTLTCA